MVMLMVMLLVTVLALSGCGFHLKGTAEQSGKIGTGASAQQASAYEFKSIQILPNSAAHNNIVSELQRALIAAGVEVKVKRSLASVEVVLELDKTDFKTTKTSTDGLGAETSRLLKMSQGFAVTQIKSTQDKLLVKDRAQAWRDLRINNASILASESEQRTIRKQMEHEIAQQILRRLQRLPFVADSKNGAAE